MGALIALTGLYLMWFGLRVSVFNYTSQYNLATFKDKQIYWGGLPVFLMGILLVGYSFTVA